MNRALVLTQKYFDGRVPERGTMNDFDRQTLEEIGNLKGAVEENLENFRFREALKAGMDVARLGNKYLADTEPWKLIKTDPERVKTILHISLQIAANLAIILEPFLPFTTAKLADYLNLKRLNWKDAGKTDLLKAGDTLKEPGLLFEKIEDEVIEKQLQKLQRIKGKQERIKTRCQTAKAIRQLRRFFKNGHSHRYGAGGRKSTKNR